MSAVVVVADDRTGAMETAGACADAGLASAVVPFGLDIPASVDCVVVDLASRHLRPTEAAARAAAAPATALHKIDSTLRGGWAHELVARGRAGHGPVLVVPAFPSAGRTCVGGVVLVDGRPVAESAASSDPRSPVGSSRPGDHLRRAGAGSVAALTIASLEAWLDARPAAFAVCDASTDDDLAEVAAMWATADGVVLAGTAATIAASAAATKSSLTARTREPAPSGALPALVVCGSLHPMALAQASAAAEAGATVVCTAAEPRDDPTAVARSLADRARAAMGAQWFATVVTIGGDTTAALLGDRVVSVGGTVSAGVAWSRPWGDSPLLLTKPGGFGTPSTVADLLTGGRP